MSEVYIVVEGRTEQTFVRDVLAPHMAQNGIYLKPRLIGKPGKKGGNIQFHRAQEDIRNSLLQRPDTYVSTMFDFFRIDSQWPGLEHTQNPNRSSDEKARIVEQAMMREISTAFPNLDTQRRFIPYIQMHEFEAVLFSKPEILAREIEVEHSRIETILNQYDGQPEEINQDPERAPSKQLKRLNKAYRKVAMGTAISIKTGIPAMRSKCLHFDDWLKRLEQITQQ